MPFENFDKLPMGWAMIALTAKFSPQKLIFINSVKVELCKVRVLYSNHNDNVYEGFTCVYGEFIL